MQLCVLIPFSHNVRHIADEVGTGDLYPFCSAPLSLALLLCRKNFPYTNPLFRWRRLGSGMHALHYHNHGSWQVFTDNHLVELSYAGIAKTRNCAVFRHYIRFVWYEEYIGESYACIGSNS